LFCAEPSQKITVRNSVLNSPLQWDRKNRKNEKNSKNQKCHSEGGVCPRNLLFPEFALVAAAF